MEGSIRPPTTAAGAATPTTVRRNPPRRARPPPTPAASAKPKPSRSCLLDDEAEAASLRPPAASSSPLQEEERLKVFVRIRPLPDRDRDRRKEVSRPMAARNPRRKPKPADASGGICLVANGPSSVALTVPPSMLDSRRGRTEVFDGFSAVFSPDSSQLDVFGQVMNPLVDDFLGGKSGLLVAMGPTGSGKTHTIFGSPRSPGILPLALRQIFNSANETKVAMQPARSFYLSMFEILSEGKEHILDLLSDAAECVLQQSTVKGLQEVAITNSVDAESLVSRGMMKRSTAATNANSKSSRSQCIITIRAVHKSIDVESEHLPSSAVLTIADLAGAEREKKTGNQGPRLLESNFINNTSMVFGHCLRSLLDHQKNQKKPLEKHFKNSMLTRYLRDFLEGRKKMTLVLNVKSGDDDYPDTSFLLRQASPYTKIKYASLEDSSDLVSQKRSNVSLICQEKRKKRKFHKPEVHVIERKENDDTDDVVKVSERDEAQHKFLNSELRRVSRSEEIMTNFAKALWTVLKQYKHKILESENTTESMKELIREKDIQIMELKREVDILNSSGSCKNFPIVRDTPVDKDDTLPSDEAAPTVSQSNQADLSDVATDNSHFVVEAKEFTCHGPKSFPSYCGLKGESASRDTLAISSIHEQEQSSRDFEAGLQMIHKESPQFTSYNKKSTTEQSEDVSAELSTTAVDDIRHDIIMGCVANAWVDSLKNAEEVETEFERCEPAPAVEDSLLNHGCSRRVERACPVKAPVAVQDSEADNVADPLVFKAPVVVKESKADNVADASVLKAPVVVEESKADNIADPSVLKAPVVVEESKADSIADPSVLKAPVIVKENKADNIADPLVLRPDNPKRKTSRRRLQPLSSMMLKDFGGGNIEDFDVKREDRSNKFCSGRSDVLIELLKKSQLVPTGRRARP